MTNFTRTVLIAICTCFILSCSIATAAKLPFEKIEYKITGVDGDILDNIKKKLEIIEKDLLEKPSAKKLRYYYSNIESTVNSAILPYGYYNSRIYVQHKNKDKTQFTTIRVKLKNPVKIQSVSIDVTGPGKNNTALQAILKNIPLKRGEIFNSIQYDAVKKQFATWGSNNGYIHADFIENLVDVDTEKNTADILLYFDTKQKFKIGEITIRKTSISESLIRKYLAFKTGDTFSSSKLLESYNNLTDSRLFRLVNISPKFNSIDKDNAIPIEIYLNTRKRVGLQTGVGYGSDSGFDSHVNVGFRRINSQGHSIKTHVRYSQFIENAGIQYIMPGFKPIRDTFTLHADVQRINVDIGKSRNLKLGISWARKKVPWNKTFQLFYLREAYTIFEDNDSASSYMTIPKYTATTKHANDNVFPSKGYKISWEIMGASKSVLSSNSFIQTSAGVGFIFTLFKIRFIQRNKVGVNFIIDDVNKLPLSLHFLEGGNNSIRGYKYQSIGTGKYLYLARLDAQIRIVGDWHFSTFYDIGNVFDKLKNPAKSSVGVGVMYKTAIGPINLGVAKGLEKEAPKFRIFFSIGMEI